MQIHSLSLTFILQIFLNTQMLGGPQAVCYYQDYIIIFVLYWLETHYLLCNILAKMAQHENAHSSKAMTSLLFKQTQQGSTLTVLKKSLTTDTNNFHQRRSPWAVRKLELNRNTVFLGLFLRLGSTVDAPKPLTSAFYIDEPKPC